MSEADPKVYLTDEQWQHVKANEDMRTREMMRHNAITQKALLDAVGLMAKQQDGDDKRDWFAGQALSGLISGYAIAYGSPTNAPDEVVREAFSYADAMIAAREVQS